MKSYMKSYEKNVFHSVSKINEKKYKEILKENRPIVLSMKDYSKNTKIKIIHINTRDMSWLTLLDSFFYMVDSLGYNPDKIAPSLLAEVLNKHTQRNWECK